ncbi:hypothetical protein A9Q87_11445 [Flavobacteriales bacterium 34_180_T64]|nr:hypothetical protein A9Q87_11445 [Flavobacteriales bacterium 34_180_T64]
MKYIKYSTLLVFLAAVIYSCEKDDICAETTVTTPHLLIDFFDINAPDEAKNVRLLTVIGEDLTAPIVFNSSTSSIALPLRFQDEDAITTTRFELIKDTDYDTDENETTASNTDVFEITYTPQFIYVSRACGYKSIFNDAQITIEQDTENWAISFDIINSTIENENEAHINIYH